MMIVVVIVMIIDLCLKWLVIMRLISGLIGVVSVIMFEYIRFDVIVMFCLISSVGI